MELMQAIEMRCSRRTYIDKPIDNEKVSKIEKLIEDVNKEGNLNLQLILNDGKAFQGIRKSYGLFTGVQNYIALVAKDDGFFREKIGYYGERVVLEATRLGLGTCWVGGSFDKKSCNCSVEEGEILLAVIAIGNISVEHTLKEKIILKAVHGKSKGVTEMYESDEVVPSWFKDGMKAAQKAPSAMNKQPAKFYYKNSIVTASVEGGKDYQEIDLGIAKLHFEIGAKGGKWQWGNGAAFIKE
jgi:nitroreductase